MKLTKEQWEEKIKIMKEVVEAINKGIIVVDYEAKILDDEKSEKTDFNAIGKKRVAEEFNNEFPELKDFIYTTHFIDNKLACRNDDDEWIPKHVLGGRAISIEKTRCIIRGFFHCSKYAEPDDSEKPYHCENCANSTKLLEDLGIGFR